MTDDTIAAIATAPGEGGVGIVRLSGPDAVRIARALFRPQSPPSTFESHRMYYGHVIDGDAALDDGLLAYFEPGSSYTGDEVVELQMHGSPRVLNRIVSLAIAHGARHAGPGEFTRRAFLNGRMDLTQAEAVADIITADSDDAVAQAARLARGVLAEAVNEVRDTLIACLAEVESRIDFADEDDIGALPVEQLTARIDAACATLDELVDSYAEGKLVRGGMRVVLIGRPNVGKSTLLNRLLGEDRAITSATPGTTRDYVEDRALIGGLACTLVDTAGVQAAAMESDLDTAAMARTRAVLEYARAQDAIVLALIDGSAPLTDDDRAVLDMTAHTRRLIALTKSDLEHAVTIEDVAADHDAASVRISARTGAGLDALAAAIAALAGRAGKRRDGAVLTRERHRDAVDEARVGLQRFRKGLQQNREPELLAVELRDSLTALGAITGETTPDEVLNIIFQEFCIGK